MEKPICGLCGINPSHSRGLCMSCYQNARRSGELNLYPTNAVIDSPLEFIEMMINHYPGDVLEHLRDLGYEITKPPE